MLLTFKIKFNLTEEQQSIIDAMSNEGRMLYNHFLGKLKEQYEKDKIFISYYKQQKELKDYKCDYLTFDVKKEILRTLHDNYSSFFKLVKQNKDLTPSPPRFRGKDYFFTLSFTQDFIIKENIFDNQRFENIKSIRNNEKKLKRLNQRLSKKQKGSKNKEKQRIKLSKYHERLNNIKENYLHLVSNQIINENQVIIMEDLNVSGMMKNKKLSKSIQELSLNRFKNLIDYKSKWYGRDFVLIDRFFPSSKLCSCCGFKNDELTLKDRTWECIQCNSLLDRDLNAAINIRNEGIKLYKIGHRLPELKPLEKNSLESSVN